MYQARNIQTKKIVRGTESEILNLDNRLYDEKKPVPCRSNRDVDVVCHSVEVFENFTKIRQTGCIIGHISNVSFSFPRTLILEKYTGKLAGCFMGDSFGYPSI